MSSFKLPEPLREPPGALLGGLRESLMASLSLSVEEDDSNFIDVVDYLLSPDKDGCVSDRVIQKYLTLNPQAKEHLVEMLKQLATTNVDDHRFADAVEPQLNGGGPQQDSMSIEGRTDKETKQRTPRIGYVRVVGATPKALQLLQVSNRVVEGVSILSNVPRYNEDSDDDDLPIISGYEEALQATGDFENHDRLQDTENGSSRGGCKKKKRKKRRNNKKRSLDADVELEIELEEAEKADVYREMYRIDETLELFRKPLQIPQFVQSQGQEQQQYIPYERLGLTQQQQLQSLLAEKVPVQTDSLVTAASRAATLKSNIVMENTLKPEALFDKEFKFKSVNQQDTKVATWDELKCLVSEVFPHDSELKKAVDNKSQNSFELWKFVVKYGKMYKDFVNEVLEMVNELKKGLHYAMDGQREKTTEILESHKKEMCDVVEKARIAENKIDLLEKQLDQTQQLLDDQNVKLFGQEEELEKLRKEHIVKDKKIKDFDNVKKSLVVEKNRAKEEVKKVMEEMREFKNELEKERKSNEALRGKVRRETERMEDLEYKLRELENQHYDDQTEMENLQERNNVLTYKVDDLLGEIAYLKEKLAKQETLQLPSKPVMPVVPLETRQRLSQSLPSEDTSSCSSFGVFTESSSSSSIGSKTPFSGMSSAVESPKGCSPAPIGTSRGHATSIGSELHSLLNPEVGGGGSSTSDPRDDVFERIDRGVPPASFSRTIRKADSGQATRTTYPPDRILSHTGDVNFHSAVPQDDVNRSPGYNPWGPSSFAGFSTTSLLGQNDRSNGLCSTLFNILPSNLGGLPNGLLNIPTAPPGLEGMNAAPGCGIQAVGLSGHLDSDLNNNLRGHGLTHGPINPTLNCGSTMNATENGGNAAPGSYSSGNTANGTTTRRRPPVRRSLDFSDLGPPFYA